MIFIFLFFLPLVRPQQQPEKNSFRVIYLRDMFIRVYSYIVRASNWYRVEIRTDDVDDVIYHINLISLKSRSWSQDRVNKKSVRIDARKQVQHRSRTSTARCRMPRKKKKNVYVHFVQVDVWSSLVR